MPYLTDERLKSYLDTNQLSREQMCRAILEIDKRFSEVRPRHPRGGPDGGRDLEAIYRQNLIAVGAIGFVNQANDSEEQKRKISKKFAEDLSAAMHIEQKPNVFVFFTNINLTIGEKDALTTQAISMGLNQCDIFDRERLRISLDSPDGFSIRYQYLGLPLSDAEQASFFAAWGDGIHAMISSNFQKIEKTLNRILFLQEAADVLVSLTVTYELDREYDAVEIGHFRAFCLVHLKAIKNGLFEVSFGATDKSDRTSNYRYFPPHRSGIFYGVSGGQWEQYLDPERGREQIPDFNEDEKWQTVGAFSAIGRKCVKFFSITYSHDDFIRFRPRLALKDLDEAAVMPFLNRSFADKLKNIHIYANGYKLREISSLDFKMDTAQCDPKLPIEFDDIELSDQWVRLRPSQISSSFSLSFYEQTPRKMFSSEEIIDSLAKLSD